MRRILIWILVAIMAWVIGGCTASSPETGNTTRTYKDIAPMKITNSGQYAYTVINITSDLTGSSQQDQEMGDISTSVDPVLTAAWEAAQAMGAKDGYNFMKDIAPILEKWIKIDEDNSQVVPAEPGGGSNDPGEVPDIGGGGSDGGGDAGDPSGDVAPNWDNYDIVASADCLKDGMTFRDSSETVGVPQNLCRFERPGYEYGESFTILWTSGNYLVVPNSASMAWLQKNEDGQKDYRKYQPQEPVEGGGFVEGTPAEVYAGRGDKSTKAYIVIKKIDPDDDVACELPWLGKDPDPDHDRAWWS